MVAQLRRARERELELNRLERFTALGQLAGALAHEIKNPLELYQPGARPITHALQPAAITAIVRTICVN